MNIEELELSLRSEFESQMNKVLAGIKRDADEFKKHFEAEFEKHRAELDRAISDYSARLPEGGAFDAAFTESVNEHLRLARDDGAQVAATAFGEAEKLKESTQAPAVGFDHIREAIRDISSKTSQASILKALVDHASNFAPRGAFFIVRNDQLLGWNIFGKDATVSEDAVRNVQLSLGGNTLLSATVASLAVGEAAAGSYAEDASYLDELNFGRPEKMYAIPLTARGRGVAVLYADNGNGGAVNIDALDTLVRVAGLTVELLAASHMPRPAESQETAASPAAEPVQHETDEYSSFASPAETETETPVAETQQFESPETYADFSEPAAPVVEEEAHAVETEPVSEAPEVAEVAEPADHVSEHVSEPEAAETSEYVANFETADSVSEMPETVETVEPVYEHVEEYTGTVSFEAEPEVEEVAEVSTASLNGSDFAEYTLETNAGQVQEQPAEQEGLSHVTDFAFGSAEGSSDVETEAKEEPAPVITAPQPVEEPAYTANGNGHAAEPVVEVVTTDAVRTRLSDRNVDLPIEVADDERRLHNDARRFARLLVSEIKLYNEQKVSEGRESSDLYDRLREAIDRSREMYDKRVQPAVASKFDYFHYELVNNLAEGEPAKLGAAYPGAVV